MHFPVESNHEKYWKSAVCRIPLGVEFIVFGFRYNDAKDDYKVVRMVQFYGYDEESFWSEASAPGHLPSRLCFWELTTSFPGGHPSWDFSGPSMLNFGVLMGSEARSPNFRCGMPPLSYHSSTQGSTHHSGRHILPPKGIDVLVNTPYSVGSALIPFVTTRSHLSTILSALGSVLDRPQPQDIYPHGFVSGSSRPASQGVTHPGISLVQARLTSEFSWDPKPVSLPKGLVLN
ncbi:hypothetical protein LguiB_032233 [Lonicera macranthoides]